MINKLLPCIMLTIGALIGITANAISLEILAIVCIAAAYLVICIVNLEYGILITILIRSSLDFFSGHSIELPFFGYINIASIMGVFIILLMILSFLYGKINLNSPLTLFFLLFLCFSLIPTFTGGNPGISIQKWMKFASQASLYIIVYNLAKGDNGFIAKIINFIAYSACIPLSIGMYQFVTHSGNMNTAGLNRLYGTFIHPNPFAFYLLIIIVVCIIKINLFGYKKSIFHTVILILSFIELVFTYTRGAWIGLMVIGVISFFKIKNRTKYKYAFIIVCLAIPFIPLVADRFTGLLSVKMEDSSLATRFYIWENMFWLSLKSPVIGHGLGTFEIYAQQIIGWYIEAHNEYLRMFFETGILGLTAYVLLLLMALRTIMFKVDKQYCILKVMVFSLFFGFAVMNAGDNIADNLVSQWYLWSLVAVANAFPGLYKQMRCVKGVNKYESTGS